MVRFIGLVVGIFLCGCSDESGVLPIEQTSEPLNCANRIACGPADECRGHWRADEGSGTVLTNSSGQTNGNATMSGASFTPAWEGLGLNLPTGAEYAEVPHSGTTSVLGAITLAAWVKPAENNRLQYVVKKGRFNSSGGYELAIDSDGKPFVRFNQAASGDTFKLKGSSAIAVNTWTHLAATSDRNTATLYVNGVAVAALNLIGANGNMPLDIASTSVRLGIGAECRFNTSCNPDAATRLKGVLDEVRLFARALPPDEVVVLARRGPDAEWLFEETSGSVAVDTSGSCNDLTLLGATLVNDATQGRVLSFDGVDDHALTDVGAILGSSKSFTMTATVRNADSFGTFMSKGSHGGSFFFASHKPTAFVGNHVVHLTNHVVLPHNWFKFAAVYDGAALKVYIGSTLSGSTSVSNVDISNTAALDLGTASSGFFEGSFDNVRYYRRALSPSELP
ncbi:MAG TPA: LamG domain-containing protein [Polyangiaceae bacterium]